VYYKCKKGVKCPAEVFLLYKADSDGVALYTTGNHDHSGTNQQRRGIHPDTKQLIQQLFNDGVQKPRQLLNALRNRQCSPLPSKMQLSNFLAVMKTSLYGRHSISLGELQAWAEKRQALPDDEDEVFVCSFDSDPGKDHHNPAYFRIALSTKRLLRLGAKSQSVHADATYKLIWQGYPVLITGYSDADRKFHPLMLAVTTHETKMDFKFLFSAVIHGVDLATNGDIQFCPTHLISDAAPAIKNGFALAFGREADKVIMCWAHVIMNVDKQLVKIKNVRVRAVVREDICQLQVCPDEDSFLHASALFISKWNMSEEEGVRAFIEYFESSWLDHNATWFEGFALGFPSTNNGLEATNMAIKRQNTFRDRLELARFLTVVENDIVINWSRERGSSGTDRPSIEVATVPSRTLKIWTTAYQWASSQAESLRSGNTIFIGSAALDRDLKLAIQEYKEKSDAASWTGFDDYTMSRMSVWKVNVEANRIFQCNCPEYLKCNICKHSLGMEIRLKVSDPPAMAKTVPLGQKRKRGRPKMARPALVRQ
jgi:hypothetical protein